MSHSLTCLHPYPHPYPPRDITHAHADDIFNFIASFISDTIIIAVPIYVLQSLSFHKQLRNRLIAIFSASVFISIAWTVQSVLLIRRKHIPSLVAGIVAVSHTSSPSKLQTPTPNPLAPRYPNKRQTLTYICSHLRDS